MEKTFGGDRVGSGQKMKAHLHNYFRSTHNLSEKWASSMTSGVLYPCFCKLAMRGDSFDIEMAGDVRTIPTKGPLFGSFKMQVDFYQYDIRLAQGILHNNPLAIGLNMSQIYLPKLKIKDGINDQNPNCGEFSKSCLLKYLGMSGLGRNIDNQGEYITRNINAVPVIAYYEIAKNYYFNKQEENAYVISGESKEIELVSTVTCNSVAYTSNESFICTTNTISLNLYEEEYSEEQYLDFITKILLSINGITETLKTWKDKGIIEKIAINGDVYHVNITFTNNNQKTLIIYSYIRENSGIKLFDFPISNIDDMRYDLLSTNRLGDLFIIGDGDQGEYLPYSKLYELDSTDKTLNKQPLNGLVLKTYQSDIYNNWLNAEWIEGENGINELSKVSVDEHGAFSMDALNFAQKLYNMLNRVVVAGNTYEDWLDVMYEETKRRQCESPIFLGGMSQEVMFDEVIQTTPTEDSALGSLGGRGRLVGDSKKGGKLHVKCDQPCFIIGIVSLTPRIFYTQGNEFYMTDVITIDDLHKPPMDGIGFQDLIGERLAWWDTGLTRNPVVGRPDKVFRSKIGKLPAWIEYMTSVDRAYGDFAEEYGKGYMILNRNYERDEETGGIKDATTYIDPTKYNYAFAYTALDAQNFWVELGFKVKARRLMSARLIPNI